MAKEQGGRARPYVAFRSQGLPHIEPGRQAVFVTICTTGRWELPPAVREAVLRHGIHDHQRKVWMHAAVVMPDHLHLLWTPLHDPEGMPYGLVEVIHGIKGASAHTVNRMLGRRGHVWQEEYFDRILRGDEDVRQKAEYICDNPVRKGLAADVDEWPWLWREWVEGVDA